MLGQLLVILGSVLFVLAMEPAHYWSYIFLGMIGPALAYAVRRLQRDNGGARKGEEGVDGAVLSPNYELGSTIGVAVATTVMQNANQKQPLSPHKDSEASFWTLVGRHSVMIVITLLFVREEGFARARRVLHKTSASLCIHTSTHTTCIRIIRRLYLCLVTNDVFCGIFLKLNPSPWHIAQSLHTE